MREVRATVSMVAIVAGLLASPVLAQSAANPAPQPSSTPADPAAPGETTSTTQAGVANAGTSPAAAAAGAGVDEIIVTAQKRSNSLQNVPIVVTAINRQLLQDTGVKDIKDLAILTPGLLVTSTTNEGSTTARIRGVGTVGDNPGLESSVGVVIDGVYRPRNGVGFGDLGDVDRIEVLKGPQGTLFGKSATAGVINILTAPPEFKFGLSADVTGGNYGAYGGAVQVTGPIVADKVAASLYFADRQRDGYFTVNTGPGPRTATTDTNRNFYTVRGQLLITPSDDFKLRIIADHSHRNELCCIAVITRASQAEGPGQPGANLANNLVAALGGNDGNPATPYNRNAYSNRPDGQRVNDSGISAQFDWQVGPGTLTSITAYRDWKNTAGFDADFSTADLDYLPADDSNSSQFRTLSQEVRYAGTAGKLDYLVGAFFADEKLRQNTSVLVGSQFTPYLSLLFSSLVEGRPDPTFLQTGLTFPFVGGVNFASGSGSVDRYRQRDDTYALFTDNTLHFSDALSLNVGVRYTLDDKELQQNSSNIGNGGGCAASNAAFNILSGAVPTGGAGAARRRQWHAVPAVPQPRLQQLRQPPVEERERSVRHRQAGLPRQPAAPDLRILCARVQGGRVQPRPCRMHRRDARLRAGQRGRRHADPQHGVRQGNQRFVRNRREGDAARSQAAAERDRFLPEVQGLPAQHLHRAGVRRHLGAAGDQQGRRRRLRLAGVEGVQPPGRRHLCRHAL